jgi:hypothetical protein
MNVANSHQGNKDLPGKGHNGEAKRKRLLLQEYPGDKEYANELNKDLHLVLEGLKQILAKAT